MLPRVSSALAKFLSPISGTENSSGRTQNDSQHSEKKSNPEQFIKYSSHPQEKPPQQEHDQPQPQPRLTLVPNPKESQANEIQNQAALINPFAQLLALFQDQRKSSSRREGIQIYLLSIFKYKQISKSRKGIILDQKSE